MQHTAPETKCWHGFQPENRIGKMQEKNPAQRIQAGFFIPEFDARHKKTEANSFRNSPRLNCFSLRHMP